MEPRNRAAGDRDEQNREHRLAADLKANKCRHIDRRIGNKYADDAACYHTKEQERAQIITWLHEEPHRQHGSNEAINKNNITPYICIEIHRECNTRSQHANDQYNADHKLQPLRRLYFADEETESHCHENIKHRNRSCSCIRNSQAAIFGKAIEGICHDIRKGRNDQQRKEPAEQKEKTASGLADIVLNEHAHGFAIILDGCIKCCKILHRTEENTADQKPEQCRQPAEHRCDDWSGYRAGTRN